MSRTQAIAKTAARVLSAVFLLVFLILALTLGLPLYAASRAVDAAVADGYLSEAELRAAQASTLTFAPAPEKG